MYICIQTPNTGSHDQSTGVRGIALADAPTHQVFRTQFFYWSKVTNLQKCTHAQSMIHNEHVRIHYNCVICSEQENGTYLCIVAGLIKTSKTVIHTHVHDCIGVLWRVVCYTCTCNCLMHCVHVLHIHTYTHTHRYSVHTFSCLSFLLS